jgi:hypothetical protein
MPSFDETISECQVALYIRGLGFCLFLFHMFICSYVHMSLHALLMDIAKLLIMWSSS